MIPENLKKTVEILKRICYNITVISNKDQQIKPEVMKNGSESIRKDRR